MIRIDNKDKLLKVKSISLYLVCFSLPFDGLLNSYLIGLLLLITILYEIVRKAPLRNGLNYMLVPISLYLLNIWGLLFTANIDMVYPRLETQASLLILPVLISRQNITKRELRACLISFALGVTLVFFISEVNVIYNIAIHPYHTFKNEFFSWWYTHTNLVKIFDLHAGYIAMYTIFAIFILVEITDWIKERAILKGFTYILIVLLSFFIIQLSSRMGIFSLIVITITAIFLHFGKLKIRQAIIVGSVFLLTIIFLISSISWTKTRVLYTYQSLFTTELEDQESRIDRWDVGMTLIKSNFLFGLGTGDVHDALMTAYLENNLTESYSKEYNVHNQYLSYLLYFGIIGLVVLLVNICFSFWLAIKYKNKLFLLFVLLLAISFLTENILDVQKGVVFYALFSSLFIQNTYVKSSD